MDYTLSLLTILFSAAISGGIAIYNNLRQKKLEFTYDYRKYILDKRKEAYAAIEPMFEKIQETNGYVSLIVLSQDYDSIEDLQKKASEMAKIMDETDARRMWWSVAFQRAFYTMKNSLGFMAESMFWIAQQDKREQKAKEETEKLYDFWNAMLATYFNDLLELDNIDKFRMEKLQVREF